MAISGQMTMYDIPGNTDCIKITDGQKYSTSPIFLSEDTINKLNQYTLEDYCSDVENIGLEKTWDEICQFAMDNIDSLPDSLRIDQFGELYEIGLAIRDKVLKKKSGQYYTPDDVARVLCDWLQKCEGEAVCDVACGTGKLILTYLDMLGYNKARDLISSGNLYLYDFDHIALKICRTSIAVKYGLDIADLIHDIHCDFLDKDICLPENCKVISNPPYAHIDDIQTYWSQSSVLFDTKELYSAFMEKIIKQSCSAVIITPFSFVSGTKFYSLRKEMCQYGYGHIVSFDNVPGSIFCGRKHGVFNTNTANSVRAAITVFHKSSERFGFRISPLIRFKNEEREKLLTCMTLEQTLPEDYQIIDENRKSFEKIDKNLIDVFKEWENKSEYTINDLVAKEKGEHLIDVPNTCRYYTTASGRKLKRTGSITLNVQGKEKFEFLYCMINSSFTYWWWRIYDGGITYPLNLFREVPVPYNLLTEDDRAFFSDMSKKMMKEEKKYIITKMNAGAPQENIRFPEQYRNQINKRLLSILGFNQNGNVFNGIHNNHFFKKEGDSTKN